MRSASRFTARLMFFVLASISMLVRAVRNDLAARDRDRLQFGSDFRRKSHAEQQ